MGRIAFIFTMKGYFREDNKELWSGAALRLAQSRVTIGANIIHTAKTPPRLQEMINAGRQVGWGRDPNNSSLFQHIRRKLKKTNIYQLLDIFKPSFAVISQVAAFLEGLRPLLPPTIATKITTRMTE